MGSVNENHSSYATPRTVDGGAYSLLISLMEGKEITVGKLGSFYLPSGFYVYTGRAVRRLAARVNRHLRKSKKLHWHIDYITRLDATQIEAVFFYESKNPIECEINQTIMDWEGAKIVVPGFGSSDCTRGCKSHLVYFVARPKNRAFESISCRHQWNIPLPMLNSTRRENFAVE